MSVCLGETAYPKPYKDADGRVVMPAPLFVVRHYYPESVYWALIV